MAPFSESIQYSRPNMQLADLALKGSGHQPLSQLFDAVRVGLYQASPVVAAPAFQKPRPDLLHAAVAALRCT